MEEEKKQAKPVKERKPKPEKPAKAPVIPNRKRNQKGASACSTRPTLSYPTKARKQ